MRSQHATRGEPLLSATPREGRPCSLQRHERGGPALCNATRGEALLSAAREKPAQQRRPSTPKRNRQIESSEKDAVVSAFWAVVVHRRHAKSTCSLVGPSQLKHKEQTWGPIKLRWIHLLALEKQRGEGGGKRRGLVF